MDFTARFDTKNTGATCDSNRESERFSVFLRLDLRERLQFSLAIFYIIEYNILIEWVNLARENRKERIMDIAVGDKVIMKKPHPCGCNAFIITRIGMDFKLRCESCGHEVMIPRLKAQKNIKSIKKSERLSD